MQEKLFDCFYSESVESFVYFQFRSIKIISCIHCCVWMSALQVYYSSSWLCCRICRTSGAWETAAHNIYICTVLYWHSNSGNSIILHRYTWASPMLIRSCYYNGNSLWLPSLPKWTSENNRLLLIGKIFAWIR